MCIRFIIDFEMQNPCLEDGRFDMCREERSFQGVEMTDEIAAHFRDLHSHGSWHKKLDHRKKPGTEDWKKGFVPHFVDGDDGDGEPSGRIDFDKVARLHAFMFDGVNGQIGYEVIETVDCRLLLGPYIGK